MERESRLAVRVSYRTNMPDDLFRLYWICWKAPDQRKAMLVLSMSALQFDGVLLSQLTTSSSTFNTPCSPCMTSS
jgi:hypothetical protein